MPYRILSLSGGGIRGVFQAAFLRRTEALLGRQGTLAKSFDLIVGTSTGSISAFAVALNTSLDLVFDLYNKSGPDVFRPHPFSVFLKGPRYSNKALEKGLLDVFSTKRLQDCDTKVAIMATNTDIFSHRVFTNFETFGGMAADNHLSVVDVIMASCAAPTFFQPVRPTGAMRTYVDGGLWANSPSLIGVLEGHCNARKGFPEIQVISIGTGDIQSGATAGYLSKLRPIGISSVQSVLEMMFSAQSSASDHFTQRLIGSDNFLRISEFLPKPINLDDVKTALEVLPALGEKQAEKHFPQIQKMLQEEEILAEQELEPTTLLSRSEFFFVIANKATGKCLDVAEWGLSDGDPVHQWRYHGGSNQLWRLKKEDDRHFSIISKHSKKCLEIPWSSSQDGSQVQQWEYEKRDNQLWLFSRLEDGCYQVMAKHSSRCLTASDDGKNGGAIAQYRFHGEENQKWWLRFVL